jgi:hypothetical protein
MNLWMLTTLNDKVMVKLSRMIKASHFDDREVDVMPFKKVFDELTVTTEGFLLRDTRLVIPSSLRARVVDLAHETHLGITRIRKLIRSKVWFLGIDAMVEDKVKKCMSCQASEPSGTSLAPLQMSTSCAMGRVVDRFFWSYRANERVHRGGHGRLQPFPAGRNPNLVHCSSSHAKAE